MDRHEFFGGRRAVLSLAAKEPWLSRQLTVFAFLMGTRKTCHAKHSFYFPYFRLFAVYSKHSIFPVQLRAHVRPSSRPCLLGMQDPSTDQSVSVSTREQNNKEVPRVPQCQQYSTSSPSRGSSYGASRRPTTRIYRRGAPSMQSLLLPQASCRI